MPRFASGLATLSALALACLCLMAAECQHPNPGPGDDAGPAPDGPIVDPWADVTMPDGAPEPTCTSTADHVAALGCIDNTPDAKTVWAAQCEQIRATDFAQLDLVCLNIAQSKAAVQACESIDCP